MGVKSRTRAEHRKERKKNVSFAKLNNVPTSPRKMRIVADLIRGKRVELALHILKTNPKQPAIRLHKLLLSAIANWQAKNEGVRIEESDLFVKEIQVDSGRILKRIQPAPQGRAHRIRKRTNHVTIILDNHLKTEAKPELPADEIKEEVKAPKAAKTRTGKEAGSGVKAGTGKRAVKPAGKKKERTAVKPSAKAKAEPKAKKEPTKPGASKANKATNVKSKNKKD